MFYASKINANGQKNDSINVNLDFFLNGTFLNSVSMCILRKKSIFEIVALSYEVAIVQFNFFYYYKKICFQMFAAFVWWRWSWKNETYILKQIKFEKSHQMANPSIFYLVVVLPHRYLSKPYVWYFKYICPHLYDNGPPEGFTVFQIPPLRISIGQMV